MASRLVLHFDVNKTVLMLDPAGGKSMMHVVNEMIAERAWGVQQGIDWKCVSPFVPSEGKPPEGASQSEPLCTFTDFVKGTLFPKPVVAPDEVCFLFQCVYPHPKSRIQLMERLQQWRKRKGPVLGSFTQVHQEYLPIFEKVSNSISKSTLVPSFFSLLEQLDKKQVDYRIIFRTFGDDIPTLLSSMKQHKPLRAIQQVGAFFRNKEGIHLVLGTTEKVPLDKMDQGLRFYDDSDEKVDILSGFDQICEFLSDTKDTSTLALRDYYEYWSMCGETSQGGKLLPVSGDGVRHVFFDDNVWLSDYEKEEMFIIDPRKPSGESIDPLVAVKDGLVVPVDTLSACLDNEYFWKELLKRGIV